MKILLLSDINSAHTQKWVHGLRSEAVDVSLFSLNPLDPSLTGFYKSSRFWAPAGRFANPHGSIIPKSGYLMALMALRRFIREVDPDLIHAHYATSYGLLGALTASTPFIISTWGSDILDFPLHSGLNRRLIRFILGKCDAITATSGYLQEKTSLYTDKPVETIPFGIDRAFTGSPPENPPFQHEDIVVGLVKSMATIYGIDLAIRAFNQILLEYPEMQLKLLVVGGGPELDNYRAMAEELGIAGSTHFTGAVPYHEVGSYHAMIDIFVNLSRYESFGVSVLEAAMLGKPAVVSNVGGLPELVNHGQTGYVVPPEDVGAAAAAIGRLAVNPDLCNDMGNAARQRVLKHYIFENSVTRMKELYSKTISND